MKAIFGRKTPLYVYDLSTLRKRIRDLRATFSHRPFKLLFATMANDNPELLRTVAEEGVGACVNSRFHTEKALEAGIHPSAIQFTSSGIPIHDMDYCMGIGVQVNLDSRTQVMQWGSRFPGSRIGVRINAGLLLRRNVEQCDRLGIDPSELPVVLREAQSNGVTVCGLHVYPGTNFQRVEEIIPPIRALFHLATTIPDLEYVNIGGGIGIDYHRTGNMFDLNAFGEAVSGCAADLCAQKQRQIAVVFEPGRGMAGNCGSFVTRVIDVKSLLRTTYVAVDASIAVFPRPFHNPETSHSVRNLSNGHKEVDAEYFTVVGRTTFSKDILARAVLQTLPRVGDLLLFEDAGAYSQSMISRFLGQIEPESVYLE